jgi:ATP-dependent DNA helicase RecQ
VGAVETDITADLRRLFGHPGFRPGQREAVEAILAGRDVLAVMPTGSGKSLCYQLPALVAPGVTLVVSPLIALMQDQHGALRNRGIDGVEMLTSAMSQDAVAAAVEHIRAGSARLVYVAPERFTSARFLAAIAEAGVARLAVDEAHCLSEWGHDFRPDYLRLADVRERLGSPPTIALTATATPRVADDIAAALRLQDPVTPRTGFDRPNLTFAVVPVSGDRDKPRVLSSLLHAPDALPAVVYCGRRRTCEEVAEALSAGGLRAAAYHAGLDGERRTATLTAFLGGALDVVCATTAFGMGIDKPDVRSVVHWALPQSPEEYYQQAGRAGRDGLPARCTLLYAKRDKGLIVHFIQRARLAPTDLTAVHAAAAARADERGVFRVREAELGIDEPRVALAVLERAGALELFPAPAGSAAGRIADARLSKRHLAAAVVAGRRVERRRWDRLAAIDGYATEGGCRRAALLRYFSDEPSGVPPDRCCDVCGAAVVRLPDAATPRPLPAVDVDAPALVLRAVDETGGRVGRTRIVQILRGSQGRALVAAGHDRLETYGTLAALSADDVLREVDSLIGSGALELTGGPYPLVRRPAGAQAATARDAELRAQVRALGAPGAEEGVPFLARVLAAAEDPELRSLAARSLGIVGGERAAAALRAATPDHDAGVAEAVRLALAGS